MTRQAKQAKQAKRRRARVREAQRTTRTSLWPYALVGVVAILIVGSFFLFSAGGGSSTTSTVSDYPEGFQPPSQGDPTAPVELVMFGDFQCSSCKRFETESLPQIRTLYVDQGKLRIVWRNFEHYGAESVDAANGAYCAGEQGQFWEYHDLLYQKQRGVGSGAFSEDNLISYAGDLGLVSGSFSACLRSARYDSVIAADFRLGRDQGVNGTPGFFINGEFLAGAQPLDTFVSIIEQQLAQSP